MKTGSSGAVPMNTNDDTQSTGKTAATIATGRTATVAEEGNHSRQ